MVVFSREQDYRAYGAGESALAGARGHAAEGLAVLFFGDQERGEVAAVLIHELTHLLNRRVFAAEPPPWPDEGMANDLAFSRIERSGQPRIGSLGGRSVIIDEPVYRPGGWIAVDRTIRLSGPAASLSLLNKRWQAGEALPLGPGPWVLDNSPTKGIFPVLRLLWITSMPHTSLPASKVHFRSPDTLTPRDSLTTAFFGAPSASGST